MTLPKRWAAAALRGQHTQKAAQNKYIYLMPKDLTHRLTELLTGYNPCLGRPQHAKDAAAEDTYRDPCSHKEHQVGMQCCHCLTTLTYSMQESMNPST